MTTKMRTYTPPPAHSRRCGDKTEAEVVEGDCFFVGGSAPSTDESANALIKDPMLRASVYFFVTVQTGDHAVRWSFATNCGFYCGRVTDEAPWPTPY